MCWTGWLCTGTLCSVWCDAWVGARRSLLEQVDSLPLSWRCGGCTCDACVQGGAERSWMSLSVMRISPSVTHQRQRCALIIAVAMRIHTCIPQYLHLLHCVNPLFCIRRAGHQSAHKQLQQGSRTQAWCYDAHKQPQQRLRTRTHADGWPSQRARAFTRSVPVQCCSRALTKAAKTMVHATNDDH